MDATNSYELAFHINPNIEEAKISSIKSDLEKTITSHGGMISFSKEPERTNLSYPLNKNHSSFFGYIQFNSDDAELLTSLEEQIKLNNDILRTLTIKLPPESKRKQAALRQIRSKERAERRAAEAPTGRPAPKAPSEAEEKKIEEQVEDILEKL